MSFSDLRVRNRGAYGSPFSGVGVEFDPLGVLPDHSGLTLHESGYLPHNDWWDFPNVLSPFWRLYYNFRAGHRVVFGGKSVELTPERLVLIPDHLLFHCQGEVDVPNFWLAFSVARRLDRGQKVPILLRPTESERALIGQLKGLLRRGGSEADRQRIYHFSVALLHVVLSRGEIKWQSAMPAAIGGIIGFIEKNYASAIAVPELARMAKVCPESFTRRFKKLMGCPPARFVNQVRVRQAAELLVNTDETIEAIAEKTGFANRAYFSRIFMKITGDSPGRFRRRHGAE